MAEQPIMHFHIQGDNHVYPTAAVVNNYFGQAVCESAMRMNSAPVNNVEESAEDEPLARYIPNSAKLKEYTTALRKCQSAKEVAFVVKDMYDQQLENDDVIVSKSFLEVVQGYLDFKGKSVNNLRHFVNKVVLGC